MLSQLSQLMGLSDDVYSLYSKFNGIAAEEAHLLRPSVLKTVYFVFEPPGLEFVVRSIGRDLGEKWWIPWERRKVTVDLAQLGLSTIQREIFYLNQTLKTVKELRSRIERLPGIFRHGKGWRFTLRQHTLRFIDFLLLSPQEVIERRAQEMNEKSNMLRSWYRDNNVWNLLLQDTALMQPVQTCSGGHN